MLYCQCSRRQREGRPSWATASATDARERGFYGMLGGLDCGAQERAAAQAEVTRSMVFGSGKATWPEKQDLFSSSNRRRCVSAAQLPQRRWGVGGGVGEHKRWNENNSFCSTALRAPRTQPLFARVGVSLCLNVQSESRSSRRRKSADGLIQRSSVDSVANPLHLLKQPPPNWGWRGGGEYPPPPQPPGAGLCLPVPPRLHTSYRPWLARLPLPHSLPAPSALVLIAAKNK